MPKVGNAPAREPVLAVNLFDLERADTALKVKLLKGKLLPAPIRLSKRGDDVAMTFGCPDAEAALALDLLRDADRRVGDRPTRAAVRRGGRWEPLPDFAVLTYRDCAGRVRLSSRWFPHEEEVKMSATPMLGEEC